MQNKDYRTSKYLKVIIVIFLKQPWHTLIFTLCISCPLDLIKRALTPESLTCTRESWNTRWNIFIFRSCNKVVLKITPTRSWIPNNLFQGKLEHIGLGQRWRQRMQDLEITLEKTRAKSTSKQRCSWSSTLEYGKVDGMFSNCTLINCNVQSLQSLHIAIYRCKPGAINWNLPTFEVEQNIRCIDSAASHLEGMGLEGVDITVKINSCLLNFHTLFSSPQSQCDKHFVQIFDN